MTPLYSLNRPTQRTLATRIVTASALLCLGLGSGAALGQEDERSWNLAFALGAGERSNPLVNGESIDINSVIDLSWYGERFFFDNGDFGVLLHEQRNFSLNLVATYNNERNFYNYLTGSTFGLKSLVTMSASFVPPSALVPDQKPVDGGENLTGDVSSVSIASATQGFLASLGVSKDAGTTFVNLNAELPDRDSAINSGIEFLHIGPWGDIQAQILTDVSSTHEGQEAWLSWSHPWYTRNNEFTLTLGAEWKSGNLVSYYYGVRPGEAFLGRPAYEAGSGTNTFVRFAARHAFSEHWHLVAMAEREFLSKAISNSPIVDDDETDTFFAGLLYQF